MPEWIYSAIVRVLPIVCVDVVVQNPNGKILLVRRRNEPLAGRWWVVGGRILHGESVENAARRKVLEEAGITIAALRPIGYYEGVYQHSPFGSDIEYHTISIVFETSVKEDVPVHLDSQSDDWAWVDSLPKDFRVTRYEE